MLHQTVTSKKEQRPYHAHSHARDINNLSMLCWCNLRKLLLNKKELKKLEKEVKNTGLTIVPLRLFINEKGFAKLKIALAKGKKLFDKRETIKDRDNKRDLDRVKKSFK